MKMDSAQDDAPKVATSDVLSSDDFSALLVEDFAVFYERERPALLGLAYSLSGSATGADDLVQDAFVAAYRNWSKISNYTDPGSWIRNVLANTATSRWRKLKSEAKAMARLGAPSYVLPEIRSESAHIWAEVRRLPKRQAQCVALHYINDLPVDQIADVLKISASSVKTHLSRGRATLSVALEGGQS